MSHHKRKRPKNRRAGCLLCKPQKANGAKLSDRQKHSVNRKMQTPNAVTRAAMRELDQGGGKSFTSIEDLFEDLKI